MKQKIITYLILLTVCVSLHSCLFKQDDFFDASSADRATANVEKCTELLQSSPNGWLLEYYVGANYSLGGITLLCKFDDLKVTMASTLATPNVPAGISINSLYQVKSEQSTMLTFDSYNELIHVFGAPTGSGNDANSNMGGDYEFIIMNATDNEITLQGKKYGNTMTMTRIPADLKWKEYIKEVNNIEENAYLYQFDANIDGKSAGTFSRSNYTLTFKSTEGSSTTIPFIFTPDGLRFREPVSIGGKKVQHFKWDNPSLTFTCTDDGAQGVKLASFYPKDYLFYEDFIGAYTFKCQSLKASEVQGQDPTFEDKDINIEITKNVENKSLTLKGLTAPIKLDYDRSNGKIVIKVQPVGSIGSYSGALSLGTADSYLPYFLSVQYGYYFSVMSKIEKTSPLTLNFEDDGTFTSLAGAIPTALVFHVYSSTNFSESTLGGWAGWFNNYSIEKKQ